MMLEAVVHPAASFVTLTYNEDNLPEGGTLVPKHLQDFMKRLRKNVGGCRFFGVGEYGDHSWRPHYHLALFGHGPAQGEAIASCWPFGFTHTGDLTLHSAQYVAGYVTKKMTRADDERLNGRYPEFARMSLRPGIGATALQHVADALQNKYGWDEIESTGDVPKMLRHAGRTMPLGRYMRSRLRSEMNFAEIGGQPDAIFKESARLLDVYKSYLLDEETEFQLYKGKERYEKKEKVKLDKLEARLRYAEIKKI